MATANYRFFAYEKGDDTYADINAEVYLDDELIGTTPIDPTIPIEIKEYVVEFRKNLWRLVHFKWTPSSDGGFIDQAMVRKQRVRFESTPEGAEVHINGVLQGTTPIGLYIDPQKSWDTGFYEILMTKEGYEDYTANLAIPEPSEPGEKEVIVVDGTLKAKEAEPEPEPETFTVSFVVVDTNNNPLSGASIRIQDTSGNTVETLTTDSAGEASASLQDANYDFYLSKTGYTWTDTDLGWIRIGVDADQDVTWTMDEDVVLPEPPPVPTPTEKTWFDPEYWGDYFGIDIPVPPEFTLVKNVSPGWDLYDYADDDNDYLIDPSGDIYVRDTRDIVQSSFEDFMGKIRIKLGISTPTQVELRGTWLDGSDATYLWDDATKKLEFFAVAEMGFGGGRMVSGVITKVARWLKNTRGMPKRAFKFNKTTGKFEVVSTLAAGMYVLGTLTGIPANILDTTLKIIGPAVIIEWSEVEAVGIAYMAVWSAKDLGATTYEQAIIACEKTLIAAKSAHAIVGKVPVFSDVIGAYLDQVETNLIVARADLARKKGADSPLINWIIAGNRTTITVDVERVIDGDTIDIKKVVGTEILGGRIRLLGIDTPEKFSALGEKAMTYMRSLMEGSTVTLKLDIGRIYGTYRRILAVVYVSGRCLQLDLLEKGYARVALKGENLALDEIMPEDLTGPHPHGILYYADKDFGWNAKLATFNLHGVEPGATVEVKELPLKKVDVDHGGVYKIIVGDEVKIASVKDRSEKDINI